MSKDTTGNAGSETPKYRPKEARCDVCERPYGGDHGFPDLVIPNWAWKKISETAWRFALPVVHVYAAPRKRNTVHWCIYVGASTEH